MINSKDCTVRYCRLKNNMRSLAIGDIKEIFEGKEVNVTDVSVAAKTLGNIECVDERDVINKLIVQVKKNIVTKCLMNKDW